MKAMFVGLCIILTFVMGIAGAIGPPATVICVVIGVLKLFGLLAGLSWFLVISIPLIVWTVFWISLGGVSLIAASLTK